MEHVSSQSIAAMHLLRYFKLLSLFFILAFLSSLVGLYNRVVSSLFLQVGLNTLVSKASTFTKEPVCGLGTTFKGNKF